MEGGDGDDTLFGGNGNDLLFGGAGANTLTGGLGTDTASYGDAVEGMTIDLTSGIANSSPGTSIQDILSEIENVVGSAVDDRIVGDAAANALTGGAGDDTLIGGLGADQLDAGSGVDTVDYSASGAVTVRLDGTAGIGGHAQGDTLAGIENLIGSSSGDVLTGDGGSNRFDGGLGNDTLIGGDGDDELIGGSGADTLYGGTGDDELFADEGLTATLDLVLGEDGNDVIHVDGTDLVYGGNGYDMALVGAVGSADTTRLSGIEEAVLTASTSRIRLDGLFLDDLGRISSAGAGTVEIANMGTWTNTGMHEGGYVLWKSNTTADVWISENCTVVGV